LWRSRLLDDSFSSPERLADVPGLQRQIQWPRWVQAGADVLLTFRGESSGPYLLRMRNGVAEGLPLLLTSFRVAYPRVVPMGDRGCLFSYQRRPRGGYMATYFSVSSNCSEWSLPTAVSWPKPPRKPDVHDAYALPRQDGGVDLYYVYPSRKGPNSQFEISLICTGVP
jgi:hypothetical protein